MSSSETSSTPLDPQPTPPLPSSASDAGRQGFIRFVVTTAAIALIAGLASWPIKEATFELHKPSDKALAEPYNFVPLNREMSHAMSLNGALAFGAFGGLLGLALGSFGGLSSGSNPRAGLAGLVGLILGLVAGALPPFAVMPSAWMNRDEILQNPFLGIVFHLALWSGLGAAAGFAFGLGRHGFNSAALLRGFLGGMIGAALGSVAYDVVGAVVFPLEATSNPFSLRNYTRLLALLMVSLGTALGAVGVLESLPKRLPPAVVTK